jgi:hypothetical protein
MQHRAARPHGDDGQRVGHVLGGQRRAFQRVERDIDLGAVAIADLLADIEHRRFVALAFADDDDALDVERLSWSRMAFTAAWSAAFSSPRPISSAEAMAAASDTRARPSESIRSLKSVGCVMGNPSG